MPSFRSSNAILFLYSSIFLKISFSFKLLFVIISFSFLFLIGLTFGELKIFELLTEFLKVEKVELAYVVGDGAISFLDNLEAIYENTFEFKRQPGFNLTNSTDNNDAINDIPIKEKKKDSGISTGAIVGIVIAGAVVLIGIAILSVYCLKKRKLTKNEINSVKEGSVEGINNFSKSNA